MAYISASDLTKMMMDYLKDNGCEVWRNNNLAVRGRAFIGRKGVGDIIGYSKKYGTFVSCEIKSIGDRSSPDQLLFLYQLGASGAMSMCVQQVRNEDIIMTVYKDEEEKKYKYDIEKKEFHETNT